MKAQVYILQSEKHSRFYTGVSSNIENRLCAHNQAQNKSTKSGIPWKLIWYSEVLDQKDALRLEKKIKKRGAERYLSKIMNTEDF
jgi:putative endonuclease